jgi:phytoene desaturase
MVEKISCDGIVAAADYAYVENELLPASKRNYNTAYWKGKTFAPSCLVYYIGIRKKVKRIQHHTLFFDEDLLQHSKEIYENKQWPAKPLFYVCCPSQSDLSVAPAGHENLFLLMPVAPGLEDNAVTREKYFKIMIERLEKQLGEESLPI